MSIFITAMIIAIPTIMAFQDLSIRSTMINRISKGFHSLLIDTMHITQLFPFAHLVGGNPTSMNSRTQSERQYNPCNRFNIVSIILSIVETVQIQNDQFRNLFDNTCNHTNHITISLSSIRSSRNENWFSNSSHLTSPPSNRSSLFRINKTNRICKSTSRNTTFIDPNSLAFGRG